MSTPQDAALVEAPVGTTAPAEPAARTQAAAPGAAAAAGAPICANCGARVPLRYCGNCGQRLEPPLHSLGHFLMVAFEDVTHADSRLWRTLWALFFKPGFLTREFLDGRRARYLPPVRLYLVISLVFFVWFATLAKTPDPAHMTDEQRKAVADARAAVEKARKATGASAVIVVPAAADASAPPATPAAAAPKESFHGSSLEGDTEHCKKISYAGPWKDALYRGCVQAARDNGRSLLGNFMHNLPRAMFLFLPLLAGVMMLLYWHPRHYYVEHLLFLVHNHAFAFLAILFAGLLGTLLPATAAFLGPITALYIAWYLYRGMRVMYAQGRVRTGAKLAFLGIVYLAAASVMFSITGIYSLMTTD
jgi:hypothetical protein